MIPKLLTGMATSLLLSVTAGAAAEETFDKGIGIYSHYSRDSDGFSLLNAGLSYLTDFDDGGSLTGVALSRYWYQRDDWQDTADAISLIHRDMDLAAWEGYQVEAGIARQNGDNLLTLDGSYSLAFSEDRRAEVFINRNWVETETALADGTSFTFLGGVLEQRVGQHWNFVGVGGRQEFSDHNYRNHGRAKIIYQPDLDLGLTLQLWHRRYASARGDVSRAYFNPDTYTRTMAVIGWRQWRNGWMTNLQLGSGEQRVDDIQPTPTRLLEFEVRAPSNRDYAFTMRTGYSRSATDRGPDYTYRYFQFEWIRGL